MNKPYRMVAYDRQGNVFALVHCCSNLGAARHGGWALTAGAARYEIQYVGS